MKCMYVFLLILLSILVIPSIVCNAVQDKPIASVLNRLKPQIEFSYVQCDMNPPSRNEFCEVSVTGHSVTVYHVDAVYNCCADDFQIDCVIEGNDITITETEVFYYGPCYCECEFQLTTKIHYLKPGVYDLSVMDANGAARCIEQFTIE